MAGRVLRLPPRGPVRRSLRRVWLPATSRSAHGHRESGSDQPRTPGALVCRVRKSRCDVHGHLCGALTAALLGSGRSQGRHVGRAQHNFPRRSRCSAQCTAATGEYRANEPRDATRHARHCSRSSATHAGAHRIHAGAPGLPRIPGPGGSRLYAEQRRNRTHLLEGRCGAVCAAARTRHLQQDGRGRWWRARRSVRVGQGGTRCRCG